MGTIELTKVAKVLCAVDEGRSVKNKIIDDFDEKNAEADVSDIGDDDLPGTSTAHPPRGSSTPRMRKFNILLIFQAVF